MSVPPLLYLDDLIASAQKIGRLTAGRGRPAFAADEAVYEVQHHLPALLAEALALQQSLDSADGA